MPTDPADTDPLLERQRLHTGQDAPPFSFTKRGSDNSRSINPAFSLAPTRENLRLRRVRHRTEQGRAEGQPLCHRPAG